ncbi:MAG TPA: glycosyl hydrolase 53 family protein, partial [Verrucomicrobiota bacterium]|nr:glycosyl hydrolase 53 family protein [Verrucomicrobiota bacterium]
QGVPYDMIGQSYYPFWHGTLANLTHCLTNTAQRYGKPVLVMETDFPWQFSTNVVGLPANTNGQVQFVVELAKIVKNIPNNRGAGIVWWGTEYQPVSGANQAGFGNRSFFNGSGNVLPVAGALGQTAAPVALGASITNSNLKITWPLSGAAMSLTSSSSTHASEDWLPVTNSIQNTGTVFSVTVPVADENARFYRLETN